MVCRHLSMRDVDISSGRSPLGGGGAPRRRVRVDRFGRRQVWASPGVGVDAKCANQLGRVATPKGLARAHSSSVSVKFKRYV